MIRFLVLSSLIILMSPSLNSQTVYELPAKAIHLYPTLEDMEGYAVGKYQNYYLIFGGIIRSDVPEQYSQGFPNLDILVVDFKRNRASAYTNGNLEGELGEQMGATGMSYYQQGDNLYLIGGYGYSESNNQFVSFPYITAIDLAATMTALQNGENPVASFYQICDERLAIFDGVLDYNGENFFILNGKSAYKLRPFSDNPEYIEQNLKGEARTFKLVGNMKELKVEGFQTWYDMEEFREYFGPLLPDRIEQATTPLIILEQ